MDKDYNRFRTAINRGSLSIPMRHLIQNSYIEKQDTILDYGCGRGLDGKILSDLGYNIENYDKYNEEFSDTEVLGCRFDSVTCHYVFNVIPSLEEHKALVDHLKSLSHNIFISVRADRKAIRDTWSYKEDYLGYYTTRGTFQRFYDEGLTKELFGKVDVLKSTSSYILLKL